MTEVGDFIDIFSSKLMQKQVLNFYFTWKIIIIFIKKRCNIIYFQNRDILKKYNIF